MKRTALPWDWRAARLRACDAIADLPTPKGTRVGSWVLPLDLCPTLNTLAEWPPWLRGKTKSAALGLMLVQSGGRRAVEPLPGRPTVVAYRLSSREPDADSAWTKVPLDRLTPKGEGARRGLGWIVDDKPTSVELVTHWVKAKPREGCVLIEVWAQPEGSDSGQD